MYSFDGAETVAGLTNHVLLRSSSKDSMPLGSLDLFLSFQIFFWSRLGVDQLLCAYVLKPIVRQELDAANGAASTAPIYQLWKASSNQPVCRCRDVRVSIAERLQLDPTRRSIHMLFIYLYPAYILP
jgi:hypothetical protein